MRAAEDMGFDSIWAPEHHSTEYGLSASPMVTLAAVASVTKRIRLGSGVLVLPFNDPIRVAEEAAMVDLMCDGRLDLGEEIASSQSSTRVSPSINRSHVRFLTRLSM